MKKEIKKFLLIPISELTKEDLSTRCLNILKGGKIEYIFELFLFDERMEKFPGFSNKIVKQIHDFYQIKGFTFEELNKVFRVVSQKILALKLEEVHELANSSQFKDLIKKLNNPNSKYKNISESEKKYFYTEPVGKGMMDKLKILAGKLSSKELSYFYKPNELFPQIKVTSNKQVYQINVYVFSQRIQKYFYKKLLEELRKPE